MEKSIAKGDPPGANFLSLPTGMKTLSGKASEEHSPRTSSGVTGAGAVCTLFMVACGGGVGKERV